MDKQARPYDSIPEDERHAADCVRQLANLAAELCNGHGRKAFAVLLMTAGFMLHDANTVCGNARTRARGWTDDEVKQFYKNATLSDIEAFLSVMGVNIYHDDSPRSQQVH
jgi:hypothetical protein